MHGGVPLVPLPPAPAAEMSLRGAVAAGAYLLQTRLRGCVLVLHAVVAAAGWGSDCRRFGSFDSVRCCCASQGVVAPMTKPDDDGADPRLPLLCLLLLLLELVMMADRVVTRTRCRYLIRPPRELFPAGGSTDVGAAVAALGVNILTW